MLKIIDELPAGFLGVEATDLADLLGGPTLVHLQGQRAQPLFVSILLHGNETTGLHAMQALLRRYRGKPLPRAISLFIGNVEAARYGLRRLPEQTDYNRVWPDENGALSVPVCAETELAGEVLAAMRPLHPMAAVDVHNNTGQNPHYAAVNRLAWPWLRLGQAFGRAVLFFEYPQGVLAMGFSSLCPSVTLECGKVGAASGAQHATAYLDTCLHWSDVPAAPLGDDDMDLYATAACLTVPDDVSLAIGPQPPAQLHLRADLESLNWQDLRAGTALGRLDPTVAEGLRVRDVHGADCSASVLMRDGDSIRLRRATTPAMLTTDMRVIRQDCLCYLLDRIPLPPA